MDPSPRPGWWHRMRRAVAVASITFGLSLVGAWLASVSLSGQVTDEAGAAGVRSWLQFLGWLEIGLSVVVIGGLAAGAWLHRPLWARGVATVIVGMVLHWGWWVLDRRFDLFGTSGLTEGDPALVVRTEVRLWAMLAADALAVLALVVGGLVLLWHRDPAERRDDEGPVGPADGGAEERPGPGEPSEPTGPAGSGQAGSSTDRRGDTAGDHHDQVGRFQLQGDRADDQGQQA